jgi:hypothetical protein
MKAPVLLEADSQMKCLSAMRLVAINYNKTHVNLATFFKRQPAPTEKLAFCSEAVFFPLMSITYSGQVTPLMS